MSTGISTPLIGIQGRLKLDSGPDQVAKLIGQALGEGTNLNPYNTDAGLQYPLFDLNLPATRALVKRDIEAQFARFEGNLKARLLSVTFQDLNPEELGVLVRYVDLETDDEREIERAVRKV